MRKNNSKFFCLTGAVLFLLSFSNSALAENSGLGVDTSAVMLRIEPGKELDFSFNIKNQTDSKQIVHLEQRDIEIGNENAVSFLDVSNGPSSWVVFEENDFTLESNQGRPVKASLKIPENQKASIQMMTMVSFSSSEDLAVIGPRATGSIGVYTLLSGSEAQNASGKIESFTYPKFVDKEFNVGVVYLNNGDVQFVPQGKVSVINLFSREKKEIPFDNHFIFPGKKITFSKDLSELSPFGFYQIRISFIDGNKQLLEKTGYVFGKFLFWIIFPGIVVFLYFVRMLLVERKKNSQSV